MTRGSGRGERLEGDGSRVSTFGRDVEDGHVGESHLITLGMKTVRVRIEQRVRHRAAK